MEQVRKGAHLSFWNILSEYDFPASGSPWQWIRRDSIAPILLFLNACKCMFLSMNPPWSLGAPPHKNGQSTKGVVSLADKILRGWSSSIYPNSRILIVNPWLEKPWSEHSSEHSSNLTKFYVLRSVLFVNESTKYIGCIPPNKIGQST